MGTGIIDHSDREDVVAKMPVRGTTKRKIVVASLGILLLAAYFAPILLLLHDRLQPSMLSGDKSFEVALDIKIVAANFAKSVVTAQIVPEGGSLLQSNGRLARDVTIETDPGTGTQAHTFHADQPLTPWVVNLSSDAGDIFDYPFDNYRLDLEIAARSEGRQIKVAAAVDDTPHDVRATSRQRPAPNGDVEVEMRVSRTGTIIFVALLSTVSLIIVSIAACAVAWHVAMRERKLEFSMLVWVAALLFVIPAVRTTMPGSVPMGVLIDYVVFFWLQIAVAAVIAVLAMVWVRRPAS